MVNINGLERDGLRQAELCPRHTMVMSLYKTRILERGYSWYWGYNSNKFGRRLLDNATCQIPKTWAFWLLTRSVFKVFPIWDYVKHVTPWAAPFKPKSYNLNSFGRSLLDKSTCQKLKIFPFLKSSSWNQIL